MLPLASAFVTATYPQEATTVGWEGQEYMGYYSNGHFDGFVQYYGNAASPQPVDPKLYESFKAGGGAGDYSQAYREGYVSGWEDALDGSGNLPRLLEWIRGEQGQELVAKCGYARL